MDFSKVMFGYSEQIEPWMNFTLKLGEYFSEYAIENKKTFNFYIKTPEAVVLSHFLLLGMFNYQMEQKIDAEEIINKLKELQYGDSIYFFDNNKWKQCSVIEVIKDFTSSSPWHIKIRNHKKVIQYIPYERWEEQVVIANRKTDTIKNARFKKDLEEHGIVLERLFSKVKVKNYSMLGKVAASISGNRTEFNKKLKDIFLTYDNRIAAFEEIIRDGNDEGFQNIQWLSENKQTNLAEEDWILLIGASYGTKKFDEYEKSGKIILDDHFGNAVDSEFLRDRIEQDIILNKKEIITNQIINHLEKSNVNLPKGVVVLAWR